MNKAQHVNIVGVRVHAGTYTSTLLQIHHWTTHKIKTYLCVSAVHLIMECHRDPHLLCGVNKAGLVVTDGMPLVWLARLWGHPKASRVYGPALMERVCGSTQRYRIALVGGAQGQSEKIKEVLESRYPGGRIVASIDTPVRPMPTRLLSAVRRKLNSARPDIVFVGMGCPFQELWMIHNRPFLDAPVLIGVGAAFDYISGAAKQCPVWMQNIGLEWLFRLGHEPRRLWYRYSYLNAQFLWLVMKQMMGK